MKLLICTQAVDKNDPVLGFFHRWIEEFAQRCEEVTIICLKEGEHALPFNVRVLSLGKERLAVSRLRYAWRFWKIIWRERANYDKIFVHMNQEYVLLGSFAWRAWGKKIYFWRNHKRGTWLTNIAVYFSSRVFCTSESSYTFQFQKTVRMPVGIDTDFFAPATSSSIEREIDILSLGRLSPVKRVHLLIEACKELSQHGVRYAAAIVGDAVSGEDDVYAKGLKRAAQEIAPAVSFFKGSVRDQTREWYHRARIFVNLTPTGSFDKTILEAASCGCIALASSEDYVKDAGELYRAPDDSKALAEAIQAILSQPPEVLVRMRADARAMVVQKHSLNILIPSLISEMEKD